MSSEYYFLHFPSTFSPFSPLTLVQCASCTLIFSLLSHLCSLPPLISPFKSFLFSLSPFLSLSLPSYFFFLSRSLLLPLFLLSLSFLSHLFSLFPLSLPSSFPSPFFISMYYFLSFFTLRIILCRTDCDGLQLSRRGKACLPTWTSQPLPARRSRPRNSSKLRTRCPPLASKYP